MKCTNGGIVSLDAFMHSNGYAKNVNDHCHCMRKANDISSMVVILCMDDMPVINENKGEVGALRGKLHDNFDIKDIQP